MNVRYRVELSQAEREELTAMLSGGRHAARKLKRAQILLAADIGSRDEEIARTVRVSASTVYRTKRRFVEGNLDRALSEEPRPGAERKLTGKEEALPVATACAKPPAGRRRCWPTRWSSSPITTACRARPCAAGWQRMTSSRGAGTCGAFPMSMANTSPAWKMCSISTLKRLIPSDRCSASTKPPSSSSARCASRSHPSRESASATITSTAATAPSNLFVAFDAHRAWRKVEVTERRTAVDYAHCMRELVDVHYPKAACIRVVQDNLSIHAPGALYQAFAPAEARRILRRLEFHYTPKHASWLNMVEIEIGVLQGQCLGRRIDDPKRLRNEIATWERQRNNARARINWMFTTDKARAKLARAYPDTPKESKSL